jgi:hypothetical protein
LGGVEALGVDFAKMLSSNRRPRFRSERPQTTKIIATSVLAGDGAAQCQLRK